MGASTTAGWIVFFATPLVLWLISMGFSRGAFAFISSSEGRLSLSRLQALAWTLVVFGSFVAAMATHVKIVSPGPGEKDRADSESKAALDKQTAAHKVLADALTDSVSRSTVVQAGATTQNQTPAPPPQAPAVNVGAARATSVNADSSANRAQRAVAQFDWVAIPAALLALTGIAIGTGVLSSLISVNKSDVDVSVAQITSISKSQLNTSFPGAGTPRDTDCLVIAGSGLSGDLRVRFENRVANLLHQEKDGSRIVVDIPPGALKDVVGSDGSRKDRLTIDCIGDKLCYGLVGKRGTEVAAGNMPTLSLGPATLRPEVGDLFRDEHTPNGFDLMKFQMFGWTVIAIGIYVWLFLTTLNDHITSLPAVDTSIVTLTGLSQSGYLASKGLVGGKSAGTGSGAAA